MSDPKIPHNVRLDPEVWERLDRALHMGLIASKQDFTQQAIVDRLAYVEDRKRRNAED